MSAPSGSINWFSEYLRNLPVNPGKWTYAYLEKVKQRHQRRLNVLVDRIDGVTDGRVMPDRDEVTIGSGRQFSQLAVLFLDICGFSSRPNWTPDEQRNMLAIMNVFMAEMLSIIRDFDGTYEKNTGDGLMAYFGESGDNEASRLKPAVEAAVVMHYINDTVITPLFRERNVLPISFRAGVDIGPVTIARVGIHGNNSSLVAIGTTANLACKLMKQIPNGGICIGNHAFRNLPENWAKTCRKCEHPTGFFYTHNQAPYEAWELNHRLTTPLSLFSAAPASGGILGGLIG